MKVIDTGEAVSERTITTMPSIYNRIDMVGKQDRPADTLNITSLLGEAARDNAI